MRTQFPLLASAARTADAATANIETGRGQRGLYVFVDVTAINATPVVTLRFQVTPEVPNSPFTIANIATDISATGEFVYYIGRDAVAANGITEIFAIPLPPVFRILMDHADADSITYSVQGAWVE